MSNPYRDPFSSESREMREAGRTPFGVYEVPRPYGGSPTCQESVEISRQVFTRCGEPIVTNVPRDFPSSSPLYLCITHATRLWNSGERRMTLKCSVCGAAVKYPS